MRGFVGGEPARVAAAGRAIDRLGQDLTGMADVVRRACANGAAGVGDAGAGEALEEFGSVWAGVLGRVAGQAGVAAAAARAGAGDLDRASAA